MFHPINIGLKRFIDVGEVVLFAASGRKQAGIYSKPTRKRNPCDLFTQMQKFFLQRNIIRFRVMMSFFLMKKITTALPCFFIVAHGKPYLCLISFLQVVRCAVATHFGRDPTRVNRVGVNIFPFPCYCHAKHHHMQLGIGIGYLVNTCFEVHCCSRWKSRWQTLCRV